MYTLILLCAGSGSRSELDINKCLYKINNKELYKYSLDTFISTNIIDEIILVTKDSERELFIYNFNKLKFAIGGTRRQDSVYNGLKLSTNNKVLIHDAARFNISKEDIIKLTNLKTKSATIASKTIDTIKRIEDNKIIESLNRDNLINIQTPQLFDKDLLLSSYELNSKDNIAFSDDTSLIEYYNDIKSSYIISSTNNFKVTTKKDVLLAELYLKGDIND